MLRLAFGISYIIAVIVCAVIAVGFVLGVGRFDDRPHAPKPPKPPSLEQQCLAARGNWVYTDDGSGHAGCQFPKLP